MGLVSTSAPRLVQPLRPLGPPRGARPPRVAAAAQLSGAAKTLCFATLLIALSAVPALRPEMGGLSIHPYLFGLALTAPLTLSKLGLVPGRVLASMAVFSALYFLSMLPQGFSPSDAIKLGAAMMTTLAIVTLIRTRHEMVMLSLALIAALTVITLRGLVMASLGLANDEMGGINMMKGIANKNAYSLYALPTLLIAGWMYTRAQLGTWQRRFVLAAAMLMVIGSFSTANRSGWLGVALIGLMVLSGRFSARTLALVAAGALTVYLLFGGSESTRAMMERRLEQTTGENASDQIRRDMFVQGIAIGIDNPILGVSPQRFSRELALRLRLPVPEIDPHNVYAYIAGASGLIALAAFFAMIGCAAFPRGLQLSLPNALPPFMGLLYLFRGAFTHEILFSPTFAMGLGLGIVWLEIGRTQPGARP